MPKNKPARINKWMLTTAKSIVTNVIQFYDDYNSTNCVADVAQEIANALRTEKRRKAGKKV